MTFANGMTLAEPPRDELLLECVADGDEAALGALYDRFGGLAFGLAYRILDDRSAAEDVVLEAFRGIWRRAATFQAGRGAPRSWLPSVIHYRAIDRVRGASGRAALPVPLEGVDRVVARDDARAGVETALHGKTPRGGLAALPVEQRQTIEFDYVQGRTHSEIARRVGVPLGTVKGRLRMGLRKLHGLLGQTIVEYR